MAGRGSSIRIGGRFSYLTPVTPVTPSPSPTPTPAEEEQNGATGGTTDTGYTVIVYPTRYGIVKNVTNQQIASAFPELNATSVDNGYLFFTSLPAGHENGDIYEIRLEQAASTVDHTAPVVDDSVQGYVRKASFEAYTSSGSQTELNATINEFDSTSVVGRKLKFHIPTVSEVDAWAEGVSITSGHIYYSDGHYYIATSSGTSGTKQPTHTSGTRTDGSIGFRYLHSGYGIATIVSVPDSTHLTAVVDGYLPILSTGATYTWDVYQWSMWGYHGKYPSKVFTFAGRLGYTLDTDGYGSWLQMSKTDAYNDFGTEDFGQQLDTSGINILISGHPDNRINWVLAGYRLYMGSSSGEYNILGDKSTGAISPTSIAILPVSNIGSANVDAVKYRDMNMFVGASTQELFRLTYDYTTDDYVPDDLSLVSENLFAEGVSRMQVLRTKDRNLYFLTNTNKLRFCSFQEELKTVGTYRVDVSGDVLDFAISNAGPYSFAFLLVKRDNVVTAELVDSSAPSYMLSKRSIINEVEQGPIAEEITDTELSGKTIFVRDLLTGRFYHTVPDTDGKFTNRFTTTAIEYGLPMMSEVHTTPPFNQEAKTETLQQKSVRFSLRLFESGEFSYGSSVDFDKWYEYHNWNTQAGQEWEAQHKLMSGDIHLPSSFGYMQTNNKADGLYPNTSGVAVNIRSYSPEPFNLLMVSNIYV